MSRSRARSRPDTTHGDPRLFDRCREIGFRPRHVVEVGVWTPESSNVLEFVRAGVRVSLFEPDPAPLARLWEEFGGLENVAVLPFAVARERGRVGLYRSGVCSNFLEGVERPPAVVNDGYVPRAADRVEVDAISFADFDRGDVDLLSVDTEGSEWHVLEALVSRPRVISLETHYASYRNPRLDEIEAWMAANGYEAWYTTRADTVWLRTGARPAARGEHRETSMTHETSKATPRRTRAGFFARYLRGRGIDIGCGDDPLEAAVDRWDLDRGDAQYMDGIEDETYDFVHSSHCLEHVQDPQVALASWWRILKPGGFLVLQVPDEDLYEQGVFPSRFNPDHEFTFTISKATSWSSKSINLTDLLRTLPAHKVLYLVIADTGYDYALPDDVDQTLDAERGVEASIDCVVMKLAAPERVAKLPPPHGEPDRESGD